MTKVYGLILASGIGERIDSHIPKQFLKVAGKTLVEHTIDTFERHNHIDEIIIVVHPMFRHLMEEIIIKNTYKKIKKVLNGGATRRESSYIGVNALEDEDGLVLIHDAVRPFISHRVIEDCIKALEKYDAVDVAIPSADTIITVNDSMVIENIPQRKYMMRGQTPQAFRVRLIKEAHRRALNDQIDVTDDCGLVLTYKLAHIYVVKGEEKNIKITYQEDIFLADKLFQLKSITMSEDISLSGLKDRVVVVFGASRGIGKSIVYMAETYGAKVYGFSRKNSVDVASVTDVSEALEEVHRKEKMIHYIVNTAGIMRMGKLELRETGHIREEIDTNYIGAINIVRSGIKYLRETKGSIALFTSSSYTRGRALYSIYSSVKAAIVNLSQAMAEELLIDHVKINVINPERTATPMRLENFGKEPQETLLDPEKVAVMSLKTLLSDLTGQVIDVRKEN